MGLYFIDSAFVFFSWFIFDYCCLYRMLRMFQLVVFLEFLISSSRPSRAYLHLSISMLIFFKVESRIASWFKYSLDFIAIPKNKGLSLLLTFVNPMCSRCKFTFNSLIFWMSLIPPTSFYPSIEPNKRCKENIRKIPKFRKSTLS